MANMDAVVGARCQTNMHAESMHGIIDCLCCIEYACELSVALHLVAAELPQCLEAGKTESRRINVTLLTQALYAVQSCLWAAIAFKMSGG